MAIMRASSSPSCSDQEFPPSAVVKSQESCTESPIGGHVNPALSTTDIVECTALAISKLAAKSPQGEIPSGDVPSNKEKEMLDNEENNQLDTTNTKKSETSFSIRSSSSYSLDITSVTTSDSGAEYGESETDAHDRPRHLRHMILLILLCISMTVGLTVSVWKLIADEATGLFIAMEFLDAVLNFGQALFTVIVFRSDVKYIFAVFLKWSRRLQHRAAWLDLTPKEDIDEDTRHLCYQFVTYHYGNCEKELPRNITWRRKVYKDVFQGREFVDWLNTVGLAKERPEAERYGQRLLRGGLIQCEVGRGSFVDGYYIYSLTPKDVTK